MPKIQTFSTFPTTLTIDGTEIAVRVKRMTNTEFDGFEQGLARWHAPRGPEEAEDAYQARNAEASAWMRQALDAYLTIVAGELTHDGREVTSGGELLDIYGGRLDVVPQAIALIGLENRLSDAQKKSSRSRLASLIGSEVALLRTAIGDGPEPTADAAAPSGSVPVAGVTGSLAGVSSGTTVPSS